MDSVPKEEEEGPVPQKIFSGCFLGVAAILSNKKNKNGSSTSSIIQDNLVNNGTLNLWDYMINIHEASAKVSTVFKAKDPKRYIQVKTTVINNGTQILAVCSDITRIKKMEKEGQILRS